MSQYMKYQNIKYYGKDKRKEDNKKNSAANKSS